MNQCTVLSLREAMALGDVELVDVREFAEFAGARVAGARLMPLGQIEDRHSELDPDRPVHVICRTGRRSAEACNRLELLGFSTVINVTGGMEAWEKARLPIERDDRAPWSIDRQVRFTAGLLVLTGVLLSVLVHTYFILLSGLVGFGLAFTATIDWCGMGLLLARMPWNRRAA